MVHVLLVYKEIFVPILFSPLLSRSDLKTGYIAMARIISLSTQLTLSGQIHDGAKLFASEEKRAKIRQGKNNPVNSIQLIWEEWYQHIGLCINKSGYHHLFCYDFCLQNAFDHAKAKKDGVILPNKGNYC